MLKIVPAGVTTAPDQPAVGFLPGTLDAMYQAVAHVILDATTVARTKIPCRELVSEELPWALER
jgi:hypothetical protein